MKLIKIEVFKIEYDDKYSSDIIMLLEASSFAEAEKLFTENYPEYRLRSITRYYGKVLRKSIKTISVEV